jgi:hypothetical protein
MRRLERPLRGALGVLGALVACALAACGSKSDNPAHPMYVPDGSAGGTTGIISRFDGSIAETGTMLPPPVDAGAPNGTVVVTIQSPAAGAILSGNAPADIAAKVDMSAMATDVVDPASVRASLSPANGALPIEAVPLVGPVGGPDLFTGKLSLAGVPTGDYTLTVTARSSANAIGSATVKIQVDSGPKITVISPTPGHHYKGSLIVQALIDPGTFPPASGVASTIAGTAVNLQPVGTGNLFRGAFDLTMPNQLQDDQLFEIQAKDSRGTVTDIKFTFNVDITGPVIASPLPEPGAIVGQVIRLAANISDAAGLDDSSIQVLIGDKTNPQFKLPLALDSMGAYSTLFDTRLLTSCKLLPSTTLCIVRPTISFRAADALGNETTLSYEIAVDNLPPIADLVPPPIRSYKIADGYRCSWAYDPLSKDLYSGDAPNDGCRVPQMFDLRGRVEDTGNQAAGEKATPISEVDPEVTAAYVLADTSQPLVVDIDGDGNCDVINPKLVPTTSPLTGPRQVLKVRLKPVPVAGTPDYRPDPSIPATLPCVAGSDVNPPTDICKMEQPWVAISYATGLPAIWAVEPIAPDDARYCFGSQLDTLANNVPEAGWRCIAIATGDKNGNLSTSMPIRVWVDYKYQGSANFCAPPPPTAGPMPNCTGTYNRVTDTLSNTACKTRTFTPPPGSQIELCFNNNCNYCGSYQGVCD